MKAKCTPNSEKTESIESVQVALGLLNFSSSKSAKSFRYPPYDTNRRLYVNLTKYEDTGHISVTAFTKTNGIGMHVFHKNNLKPFWKFIKEAIPLL